MSTEKINILVIDDSIDILKWFNSLNKPDSLFQFHALQNELKITEALMKVNPALIFLDINLTTLDGPLISSIINGNGFDSSRIVAMSADAKNKRAVNTSHFIEKPLTKELVMNKIRELIKIS